MKKIICAIALLTATLSVSAQDGVVRKAAYKMDEINALIGNNERTPKEEEKLQELINSTLEMIEPALTSPETKKKKGEAWGIKSTLELYKINPVVSQLQADQPIDTAQFAQLVFSALDAMEQCYKEETASGILEKFKKDNTLNVYSVKNKIYALNCRQYMAFCGQMFFTNQQYDKAVETFKKYMNFSENYTIVGEETKMDPDDPTTAKMAYFTCLAAYFAKEYDTLKQFMPLAKKYTDDINQVNQLEMTALIEQGDTIGWLKAGKKIVLDNPQDNAPLAQNLLAYYFNKGDQQATNAFIQELLDADSQSAIGNYAKGLVLMNDKNYSDAIPFFEKATDTDPGFSDAWYNAGVCHSNIGYDINEAINQIDKDKKLTWQQKESKRKAELQKVKDEYAKAEPYFLKVKELEPENPHKWASRLSTVYYILDNKAKQAEMDKLLE